MNIIDTGPAGVIPVIDGTAEELAKLAAAALAAIKHQEAVAFHGGSAMIGFRLVDEVPAGCACVGTADQEDCPHE